MAIPDSDKHFMLLQDNPGLINTSYNQLKEMASEKVLILNTKKEYHFHGAVGQFIEHADNIETPTKKKKHVPSLLF